MHSKYILPVLVTKIRAQPRSLNLSFIRFKIDYLKKFFRSRRNQWDQLLQERVGVILVSKLFDLYFGFGET